MTNENSIDPKFALIRNLAAEIVADYSPDSASDAAVYDFCVRSGLADATVEILNYDSGKVVEWFKFCLIGIGVKVDARIEGTARRTL